MVASGQLIDAKGRQSSEGILSKNSLFGDHRRRERLYALGGACGRIDNVEIIRLGFGARGHRVEQSAQCPAPSHKSGKNVVRYGGTPSVSMNQTRGDFGEKRSCRLFRSKGIVERRATLARRAPRKP
jgi:hypothetical protein